MHYWIFGATSGIGKTLGIHLQSEGHRVTNISRTAPDWSPFEHHSLDVTSDDWSALPVPASLDGLIYCPGSIVLKPFRGLKPAQFQEDFEVNVVGAVRAIRHALPALKKGSDPSVVLFSTVAVQQGMPFHASVAAAKGAVEGLTRSLAAELAPTIRVNAVAPSLTQTPLAESLLNNERKQEAANQRHPLHRFGQPDDIARAAAYLLSHSWTSGQVLQVDGGLSTLRP
jgi:NAD(P)-dependent dehydrogenase (short-subunit alcohol dehydrogenase family)